MQVLYDHEIIFTLYIFLNKVKAMMAMIQEIKETNKYIIFAELKRFKLL
jgi:hypothetical protein